VPIWSNLSAVQVLWDAAGKISCPCVMISSTPTNVGRHYKTDVIPIDRCCMSHVPICTCHNDMAFYGYKQAGTLDLAISLNFLLVS
jgi:hypothetical protein